MFPSYVSSSSGGSLSSSLTMSGVNLGTPATNRLHLVGITTTRENAAPLLSCVKLGGVNMQLISSRSAVSRGDEVNASLYALIDNDLPDGSLADLVISGTFDAVIAGAVLIKDAEQSYLFGSESFSSIDRRDNYANTKSLVYSLLLIDVMSLYEHGGGATVFTDQIKIVDRDIYNAGALLMSLKKGYPLSEQMGWSWINKHRRQAHLIAAIAYSVPTAEPERVVNALFFGGNM